MPPYISGVIDPNIIITPGHGVNICTSPTASDHKIKKYYSISYIYKPNLQPLIHKRV